MPTNAENAATGASVGGAVGTAVPIPGVGTGVGATVGAGLGYAYNALSGAFSGSSGLSPESLGQLEAGVRAIQQAAAAATTAVELRRVSAACKEYNARLTTIMDALRSSLDDGDAAAFQNFGAVLTALDVDVTARLANMMHARAGAVLEASSVVEGAQAGATNEERTRAPVDAATTRTRRKRAAYVIGGGTVLAAAAAAVARYMRRG